MESKKTLVIGGSVKPERFSNIAIRRLRSFNVPVVSIGMREGEVEGVPIEKGFPPYEDIHTVTLYVGPRNQPPFYDYILNLKPRRIIFNPGTENRELREKAREKGIETIEHCTLVMLNEGSF